MEKIKIPITIEIPLREDESPWEVVNSYSSCWHTSVVVDEKTKTVRCKECGYLFDHWEYIRKLAKKGEAAYRNLHAVKHDLQAAKGSLEGIKREIKNAKSRLNRLSGQLDLFSKER